MLHWKTTSLNNAMRLTDKSLLSELIIPLLIGLLAFLLMLVGNTLYALLERMMQEKWPIAYVARILLFNIPTVLVKTIPIAGAVGASLATSRLTRDSEITALRSVGIPLRRIFAPVFAVGLLLTAADIYIFEKVVPWAWNEQSNVQNLLFNLPENAIESATTIVVEPYVFSFSKAEGQRQNGAKAFKVYDTTILELSPTGNEPPRVSTATTGIYQNGTFTFNQVAVHAYRPDGAPDYDLQARTEEISVQLESMKGYGSVSDELLENLESASLLKIANDLRKGKNQERALVYEVARWRKVGIPALCLPLALFAVPLALRFAKTGPLAALMLSLILVFLGYLGYVSAELTAYRGFLPPPMAALAPSVLLTLLAFGLLWKRE